MRKMLLALIALAIPAWTAAGLNYQGTVRINPGGGFLFVTGCMDVRFNASQGNAYVAATTGQGNMFFSQDVSVHFGARDSSGASAFCLVPKGDPMYAYAIDAALNFRNGSCVTFVVDTASGNCVAIDLNNHSAHLD